eukprot:750438-Rhodomonas_salina.2
MKAGSKWFSNPTNHERTKIHGDNQRKDWEAAKKAKTTKRGNRWEFRQWCAPDAPGRDSSPATEVPIALSLKRWNMLMAMP